MAKKEAISKQIGASCAGNGASLYQAWERVRAYLKVNNIEGFTVQKKWGYEIHQGEKA